MAFASNIWLVIDETKQGKEAVLAAFTCPRDLRMWAQLNKVDVSKYNLVRVKDGVQKI